VHAERSLTPTLSKPCSGFTKIFPPSANPPKRARKYSIKIITIMIILVETEGEKKNKER
jgi:hypothetical protein